MISDEDLVEQAKQYNEQAFNELVKRYRKPVYFLALRMIGDEQEAEDVLQEVFLNTLKSLNTFDSAKASFKTWLFRIAKNKCVDRIRKYKNNGLMFDESRLEAVTDLRQDPNSAFELAELTETLSCGLLKLSAEQRLCLLMRTIDGFSYNEIAKVIELPVGTVKSRIFSARKALLKEISYLFEGEIPCNASK
jgi:RNA polymerase sigma-70 factor (ECF subfamily)